METNMLINFKVENFRSIRDQVTLSLVASNYDHSMPGNLFDPTLRGLKRVRLLKGAAVYGANASGKTSLISAFRFMRSFVRKSAMGIEPNASTEVTPFILNESASHSPSHFEVNIVVEGIRYLYGFQLDSTRIYEEYLTAYPKGIAQSWFRRTYCHESKSYSYEYGSNPKFFRVDKELEKRIRPNSLYLSMGSQFNHEQMTVIYSWFSENIGIINGEELFTPVPTARKFLKDNQHQQDILKLLKCADFGIQGVHVEEGEMSDEDFDRFTTVLRAFSPTDQKPPRKDQMNKLEKIGFRHQSEMPISPIIDLNDESAGTQRFFAMAWPWLDSLERGLTLVVDSLDTSLHPLLLKELLTLFFSDEHNPKGAQIIFTTQSPILFDFDLLRRDQIWFTEKDRKGATYLHPLTDYKPRQKEALIKGYLAGRYGGIPFIMDGLCQP
jgi:AAA15 family ATPase/GTPase